MRLTRVEFVGGPQVEQRTEIATLGIRTVTPFRGMLAVRDRLLTELTSWVEVAGLDPAGPYFLRLHVVDMAGPMDLEVGVAGINHPGDDRVRPGALPAGTYATLVYRATSMPANRALFAWIDDQGLQLDRDVLPEGDRYGCRTESYLTDPRTQPRKKLWDVELAFRLRD